MEMNFSQLHHEEYSIAPLRCKSIAYDVNQQADSLVCWEQKYDQHSQGIFTGYLDELKFGGLHLFEEFTNQKLHQKCCINEDCIWLGFSLQPKQLKINGYSIDEGQLMVRPSGAEFELLTPSDFHIFGMVIDKQSMIDQLSDLDKNLWLKQADHFFMTSASNYVVFELAKIISLCLNHQSPIVKRLERIHPIVMSRISDLLVSTVPEMMTISMNRAEKRRIIDRINEHINNSGRYPLTVSELCRIAYVSRRTLQYCFEHELGISPIQYLRGCRLNEIRRILQYNRKNIVVSDLAIEYGFYHISSFNYHYKQLFGETPTQTMLRAETYKISLRNVVRYC